MPEQDEVALPELPQHRWDEYCNSAPPEQSWFAEDMTAYGKQCYEAGVATERERTPKALKDARVLLDSLANHTLSRNNLEALAAEWLEENCAAAIRKGTP